MGELGNIFQEPTGEGPKGRSLKAEVTVPAASLGHPDGFSVEVPLELPVDGQLVARTPSPFDEGAAMTLRLPETFPDGGALRLRGQGERGPGGRAGDLLLTIRIDHDNKVAPYLPPGAVAPASGGVSVVWWVALLAGGAGLVYMFAL